MTPQIIIYNAIHVEKFSVLFIDDKTIIVWRK